MNNSLEVAYQRFALNGFIRYSTTLMLELELFLRSSICLKACWLLICSLVIHCYSSLSVKYELYSYSQLQLPVVELGLSLIEILRNYYDEIQLS